VAYSKRCDLLFDLVSMRGRLQGTEVGESGGARSVRCEQAPRVWRVRDRLNEADVQRWVFCFREGVTVRELADLFSIGISSVKRLLREHGGTAEGGFLAVGPSGCTAPRAGRGWVYAVSCMFVDGVVLGCLTSSHVRA